jgi:hypothetical protein
LGENNFYKQQVWLYTKDCGEITDKLVNQLQYKESNLVNHFKKYNQCFGGSSISYKPKIKKPFFDLRLFTGLSLTSISVRDYYSLNGNQKHDANFNYRAGITIGLEPEFILPFNKSKWSIIASPSYQQYHNTDRSYSVQYNLIEIPLGLRYYSFLNKNTRLFINAAYAKNLSNSSNLDLGYVNPLKISPGNSVMGGIGFDWRHFSSEIRYVTCYNLLRDYVYWGGHYNRISFIIGVRLYRKTDGTQ